MGKYHQVSLRSVISRNLMDRIKRTLCNFQCIFILGTTIMFIIIHDRLTNISGNANTSQTGGNIHYGNQDLKVSHYRYSQLVTRNMAMARGDHINICDKEPMSHYDGFGVERREVKLFQTLGETNIHVVSAILDDRLLDRKSLRVFGVGLHPSANSELYCRYETGGKWKSSKAEYVMLPAGAKEDYKDEWNRRSMMNLNMFKCPVEEKDDPTRMTMTYTKCGYSHNYITVKKLNSQNQIPPPQEVAICVRPVNESALDVTLVDPQNIIMWIEYMKKMGVDHIYMYMGSYTDSRIKKMIKIYKKETLKDVTFVDWSSVAKEVDSLVSDEAALNHCLYDNMLKYRYIIFSSLDTWILPRGSYGNIKEMVKSNEFRSSIQEHTGYRFKSLTPSQETLTGKPSKSFIVKASTILSLAANHFIPLAEKPSYKEMSSDDAELCHFDDFTNQKVYLKYRNSLQDEIYPRVKAIFFN